MENSVKERIKYYLNEKNIKEIDFCRAIGVSTGYISGMRKSMQPDKLYSIAINYPLLNIGWLLTGKGNMEIQNEEKIYREKYFELLEENRELRIKLDKVEKFLAQEDADVSVAQAKTGS